MSGQTRPVLDVVHVISGLGDGGAEAVLYRLVTRRGNATRYRHRVVSLSGPGKYGPLLRAVGVEVATLNLSRRFPDPIGLLRLVRLLKRWDPDLVQTWMYHANLLGALAARAAGVAHLVWGLHHAGIDRRELGWPTYAVARACARLSNWPDAIVSVSESGVALHRDAGYLGRMHVIPNGYDLQHFRERPETGTALRARWQSEFGDPAPDFICGVVARWHRVKGHLVLFEALAALKRQGQEIGCVLVGPGMTRSNKELDAALAACGLHEGVVRLGSRTDIPELMSAFDVHALPSLSEAFPNVVAEAMACGTPCVVTDVGDAPDIVGDTGWVVPPGDGQCLANALAAARQACTGDRERWTTRRANCRARMETGYSEQVMFDRYDALWREIVGREAGQSPA